MGGRIGLQDRITDDKACREFLKKKAAGIGGLSQLTH